MAIKMHEKQVKIGSGEPIQTPEEYVHGEPENCVNDKVGYYAPLYEEAVEAMSADEYEAEDDYGNAYPMDAQGNELPVKVPDGNVMATGQTVENPLKQKKNAKFQMLADSVMFQASEPAVEDSPPFWFSMNVKGQDEFVVTASKTSVISREDTKLLRKAIKKVLVAEKEQFGTVDGPKEATATLTTENEQPNAAMLKALAPIIKVLDGNKVKMNEFLSMIQESITAFLDDEEDTTEGGNPAS